MILRTIAAAAMSFTCFAGILEQTTAEAQNIIELRTAPQPREMLASSLSSLGTLSANDEGLYAGGSHLLLLRTDGTVAWGVEPSCRIKAVHALAEGGAIVLAHPCSTFALPQRYRLPRRGYVLFRITSRGNLIWARQIHSDRGLILSDVASDADGAVYVAGNKGRPDKRLPSDAGRVWHDLILLKFNLNGALLWSHLLQAHRNGSAAGLSIGSDGELFVAAAEGLVVKMDRAGQLIWSRQFRREPYRRSPIVGIAPSRGGLILAGTTSSLGRSGLDLFTIAVAADGHVRHAQMIDGGPSERIDAAAGDGSGGILLAGSTRRAGPLLEDKVHRQDGLLVRVDGAGSVTGSMTIGQKFDDYLTDATGTRSRIISAGSLAPDRTPIIVGNPFGTTARKCSQGQVLPVKTRRMALSVVDVPNQIRSLEIVTVPVEFSLEPVAIEVTVRCDPRGNR